MLIVRYTHNGGRKVSQERTTSDTNDGNDKDGDCAGVVGRSYVGMSLAPSHFILITNNKHYYYLPFTDVGMAICPVTQLNNGECRKQIEAGYL